jgi:toxin secretion/phage lysis holin
MQKVINSIVACIGTAITYFIGGFDMAIIALVTLMVLDYITGVLNAIITHTLSSEIGFKGLFKKMTILCILIMAVLLDRLINDGTWIFRTLVAYYYIANEGISLLENSAELGLPIPKRIISVLKKFQTDGDSIDDSGTVVPKSK